MITTLPTKGPPAETPYAGLSALLPKLARPWWVSQIGEPSHAPPAPAPGVAKAQMREKQARARRSLAKRGVPGFLAALRAIPLPE